MMPSSYRVAPSHPNTGLARAGAGGPRLPAIVAALSRANSSAVAVGIASTFLLLSTVLSFAPDRGPPGPATGPPALGLRGTLDPGAD